GRRARRARARHGARLASPARAGLHAAQRRPRGACAGGDDARGRLAPRARRGDYLRRPAAASARERLMGAVLAGLNVVEFTHMVAGPSCGQVLGDLGASITKVEPPQGDITRRLGAQAGDVAALYASTNRNKDVICLDVTVPADAERARALALEADIVVSNLAPTMLERAGLDGPSLRRANPRLIVVLVT